MRISFGAKIGPALQNRIDEDFSKDKERILKHKIAFNRVFYFTQDDTVFDLDKNKKYIVMYKENQADFQKKVEKVSDFSVARQLLGLCEHSVARTEIKLRQKTSLRERFASMLSSLFVKEKKDAKPVVVKEEYSSSTSQAQDNVSKNNSIKSSTPSAFKKWDDADDDFDEDGNYID